MKRLIGLVILLAISGLFFVKRNELPRPAVLSDREAQQNSQKVTPKSIEATSSVFVPYWTLGAETSLRNYESAYYFGVEANEDGIDESEIGYTRIDEFLEKTKDVPQRYLVIRMVDKEVNSVVLKNPEAQKVIAKESADIAQEYGFDGVVLDFEISSISFGAVTNRVTEFYKTTHKEVKSQDLKFFVTLYGDTYYRVRAYDVKQIGELADRILIMTYDFHKSRGNPGPNFPLSGKEQYGYDLQQMVADFTAEVEPEKIEIVFGMFGYDWEVDSEGKYTENGVGISTQEITGSYIDDCSEAKCEWRRDSISQEITIQYESIDGKKHIIWMEDADSVKRKKDFIQNQGISKISFWAYSYFK